MVTLRTTVDKFKTLELKRARKSACLAIATLNRMISTFIVKSVRNTYVHSAARTHFIILKVEPSNTMTVLSMAEILVRFQKHLMAKARSFGRLEILTQDSLNKENFMALELTLSPKFASMWGNSMKMSLKEKELSIG